MFLYFTMKDLLLFSVLFVQKLFKVVLGLNSQK